MKAKKQQNKKTTVAPKSAVTEKKQLPKMIEEALYAQFGSDLNGKMAEKFKLTIGQTAKMTFLIDDIYRKTVALDKIESELINRLGVAQDKAKEMAIAICANRFLIADTKWFKGAASKKIKELGGDPGKFGKLVSEYKQAVMKEVYVRVKKQEMEAEDEKALEKDFINDKMKEQEAAVLKDPESEKKAAVKIFSEQVKDLLSINDYVLKIELNIRLITLLSQEAEESDDKTFQKNILEALYQNQEELSSKNILIKGAQVKPTVANWIKDFIREVEITDGPINSIKKAKYLTDSNNIGGLNEKDRKTVDKLFSVFSSIKNFYLDLAKKEIEDLRIFDLSPEEEKALFSDLEKAADEEGSVGSESSTGGEDIPPADIMKLYEGKPEDKQKIEALKVEIIEKTRKEYDKVADYLEENLISRYKHNILAAVEILAETGSLDDLISKDPRYLKYMKGFFKRNNLQGEEIEFKKNPHQAKYVQYFLKFVYLERLGMAEAEGARLAANISNVFMQKGMPQYAQLAYLDLHDHKFKWSDL
ncbi:hypothetical protein HN858_01430 [Candidatus Falkowbacteria bacterium]|jgi:hypothetical protein|nr:hypothetical protein [Candidatus Falkowbacteria bacterium]MBT5503150.1 hypothetical protein [Candidatus Falkowbacteria bacterium]MBT6574538.1 hypothetical protein [Candidatus Falkowbacteria bacterium]MBT7348315.1 hypothetical protein [Candidatus Falkowbacteria bacterium]MBT7500885.1 hypothetical protein [Candidatus Falkowbacteria bacterium]